jgi:hypothetical protein
LCTASSSGMQARAAVTQNCCLVSQQTSATAVQQLGCLQTAISMRHLRHFLVTRLFCVLLPAGI